MDITRKDNETDLQYHKRIIYGKLVDKTLSDIDYSELSEPAYGQSYSSDVARRMFYGSKRTLQLMDNECQVRDVNANISSEIDEKIMEFKKERRKLLDQRNALQKIINGRSRQEELNEILIEEIRNGDLPKLNYLPTQTEPSSNDLLVSLNDIHYGMTVNNVWNTYNPDICKTMMCQYLDKIISIANTHHSENCIVYNCGDSISGNIHATIQISNKENVVKQVKGISELIAEFLAELSKHFKTVKYLNVSGNHSRIAPKDDAPYDERLDDLIEWYLSARLQNFENILIDTDSRIDSSMFVTDIRGKTYCGVHGDFETNESKISALRSMVQKPIYAILSGHKHHNMCDEIQGIKTFMAGSFLGMDDYCIQKRIYGKPEQMVCVCDDTGVVCHYDIPL